MAKLRVRYLVAKPRKGGVAHYWQPWKSLRKAGFLPRRLSDDLPEAVRQAEALNAELDAYYRGSAPVPVKPGSVKELIRLYERDDSFDSLAPRTQADYVYYLRIIERWAGDAPIGALTRKVIKEKYRQLVAERGRSIGRKVVAVIRRLLAFAIDEERLVGPNPAAAMRVKVGTKPTRVWTDAELSALVAAAERTGRPSVALAATLAAFLGQRPADVLALAWTAYDGSHVTLRQAKTGTLVRIPALPELAAALDSAPRTAVQIVISETTGRPYKSSHFEHTFSQVRAAAGLPADLKFFGLRHTAATNLGRAGCTDDEIRAVTGHRTRAVVARYVQPDSTMSGSAMAKLRRARENKDG